MPLLASCLRMTTVLTWFLAVSGCLSSVTSEPDHTTTEKSTAALTASQCDYFATDGKVKICHATGSAKNPFTLINISADSCLGSHALHSRDYVATNDPTCSGKGFLPANAPCDPSVPCAVGLTCRAGTCQPIDVCLGVICEAPDQCHVSYCDAQTGQCVVDPKVNDFPCDDNNACTQSNTCQAGVCVGSAPVVCTSTDSCHAIGTCDPTSGSCSNPVLPDGSPCEIGTCVAGQCKTPAYKDVVIHDNPVAYYRLGELDGTTAFDEMGGGPGTYGPNMILNVPGAMTDDNRAAFFDNDSNGIQWGYAGRNGGIVTLSDPSRFAPLPATIELWVNLDAVQPYGGRLFVVGGDDANYDLNVRNDFRLEFLSWDVNNDWSGGANAVLTTPAPITANRWHHVVVVVTLGGSKMYVDGALAVTDSRQPEGLGNVTQASLGSNGAWNWRFRGALDEVAVYGYALSAEQVAQHYAMGN